MFVSHGKFSCKFDYSRAVVESYQRAAEERDRAVMGERETGRKYEQLLQE